MPITKVQPTKITSIRSLGERVSRVVVAFVRPFEITPKVDCLIHSAPTIRDTKSLQAYLEGAVSKSNEYHLFNASERKGLCDLADTPESASFIGRLLQSERFGAEEIQIIAFKAKSFEGKSKEKTLNTVYGITQSLSKKLGKDSHRHVTSIVDSAETLKQLEIKNEVTHGLASYIELSNHGIHRYSPFEMTNIAKLTQTADEASLVVFGEAEKGSSAKTILEELEKFKNNPTEEGQKRTLERAERLLAYQQFGQSTFISQIF